MSCVAEKKYAARDMHARKRILINSANFMALNTLQPAPKEAEEETTAAARG